MLLYYVLRNLLHYRPGFPHYQRPVVDPSKVQALFSQVFKRKSADPDGISALLLKTFGPAWCPIFRLSIDSHAFPNVWKNTHHYSHTKEILPH